MTENERVRFLNDCRVWIQDAMARIADTKPIERPDGTWDHGPRWHTDNPAVRASWAPLDSARVSVIREMKDLGVFCFYRDSALVLREKGKLWTMDGPKSFEQIIAEKARGVTAE